MNGTQFIEMSSIEERRAASGKAYLEFLRVSEMSLGLYLLPAGGSDSQNPHNETEAYYVVRGRGRMKSGKEDRAVSAGTMILVPPGVEHRFYDIEEEMTVLVVFAPAESV